MEYCEGPNALHHGKSRNGWQPDSLATSCVLPKCIASIEKPIHTTREVSCLRVQAELTLKPINPRRNSPGIPGGPRGTAAGIGVDARFCERLDNKSYQSLKLDNKARSLISLRCEDMHQPQVRVNVYESDDHRHVSGTGTTHFCKLGILQRRGAIVSSSS